jgi:subtilisin family serine protease
MTSANIRTTGLCALALVLAAAAALPVSAAPPGTRRAKGTPTQIPILDGDLGMQSVKEQFAAVQVGAPGAQAYSTGAGVVVAVLDGGFDLRHEALVGRLHPAGWDALDNDTDPQDLGNGLDDDGDGVADALVGHGTFVASLVLAVAPDATILPVRVLDDEGWGTEQGVAAGVDHAVAHGARVINLSLVVPDASNVLIAALNRAADAGVVVVGAAGNDADSWQNDPNLSSRVLAFGAVDSFDVRAAWSSTGPHVDAYAPGQMVVGALGGAVPDSYAYWSGTSFSTPFASGGVALLRSKHPGLTPAQVVDRVLSTVSPASDVFPLGRGRIDLALALEQ